ncbi:MAG TPA: hypothetical protein VG757_09035 [Devosia sp.]|nr:hypothetical protein [Devosia sp.]
MAHLLSGRRPVLLAVAALLPALALSACTTTEGTNAFSSFQVFEDEVLDTTAVGLGLIPKQTKPDPTNRRGPLVLPKDDSTLPAPEDAATATAALPEDSSKVKVDTRGMTEEDLRRIRNTRIVDVDSLNGRQLTEAESQKLAIQLRAVHVNKERSIYLPPEQYYSTVKKPEDLVCLAPNGELVAVNDPLCPPEIQKALLKG